MTRIFPPMSTAGHGVTERMTGGSPPTAIVLADMARPLVFLFVIMLAWVGSSPFASMADRDLLASGEDGNFFNQAIYLTATALVFAIIALRDRTALTVFLRPIYIAMIAWLGMSVFFSINPGLSFRRFAFAGIVIFLAGTVLVLPRNKPEFVRLITVATLLSLALCYAGILLRPDLAIHNAFDVIEPDLVGAWRGVFPHKNIAAAMMAIFVFVGLYLAGNGRRWVGAAIIVLASFFLVLSQGKTALATLPAVLVISSLYARMHHAWARQTLVIGLFALLALVTLGSVQWETVRTAVQTLMPGTTFTGRMDIWRFAMDGIAERPLTGHGFAAFWRTDHLLYGEDSLGPDTAHLANHAHNGPLDIALSAGLPGLALAGLWLLITPVIDDSTIRRHLGDGALSLLFIRIWMFCLFLSCFESVLFSRGSPIWFSLLIALFGLRWMALRPASQSPSLAPSPVEST